MTEPTLELPTTDEEAPDPWEPVDDAANDDVQAPDAIIEEPVPDPFSEVDDEPGDDIPLPDIDLEGAEDPWSSDLSEEPALTVPPSPLRAWLPPPPVARLLPGPPEPDSPSDASSPAPLPWRTAAELRSPTSARLLCEADPRVARSRLLVSAWEWLPEDDEHVRFRLADDGEDVVARVDEAGEPVLLATLRLAGHEVEGRLELVVDRMGRGVVLGRDLLAGRFVIDPARDDWG